MMGIGMMGIGIMGTRDGERITGNGERGTGNGEQGIEIWNRNDDNIYR